MKRTPERVAWLVLFAALFACLTLAVGIPAGALAFVNNATNDAVMRVSLQSGILKTFTPVEREGEARVVDLAGRDFKEAHTLVAGDRSVGLLTFAPSSGAAPSIKLQLYSNARLQATRARVPRFGAAAGADEFAFELSDGRADLIVLPGRRARVRVSAPGLGEALINTPGVYNFEASKDTLRLLVYSGSATLGGSTTLNPGQSALLNVLGVRPAADAAADNLVRNGNFRAPVLRDWQFSSEVGAGQTVGGVVNRIDPQNESNSAYIVFERSGPSGDPALGWGRTTLAQQINQDVSGHARLNLRLAFDLLSQTIEVCGGEGTECPLMVRIDYTTAAGKDDFWQQGFYGQGDPSQLHLPDYIRSNFKGNHIAKPLNSAEIFESENLLDQVRDMKTVKSITLYAEGHALKTRVDSVELLLR